MEVKLIETPLFHSQTKQYGDDLRTVQDEFKLQPKKGDVIPQSGGFRKLRAKTGGRGKRGGVKNHLYLH